jgi:hypothetical protein
MRSPGVSREPAVARDDGEIRDDGSGWPGPLGGLPGGLQGRQPGLRITDRSRGGVLVFVDGLPSMGKTVLLQPFAQEQLGRRRVCWWGELRPQSGTYYPERYQLLVAKGPEAKLYAQTVDSD